MAEHSIKTSKGREFTSHRERDFLSFLVLDPVLSVSNKQNSCFCFYLIFRSGLDKVFLKKVYLFVRFFVTVSVQCLYCGRLK